MEGKKGALMVENKRGVLILRNKRGDTTTKPFAGNMRGHNGIIQ